MKEYKDNSSIGSS